MRGFGYSLFAGLALAAAPDNPSYDLAPVRYSSTEPQDPVAHLKARLEVGKASLKHDDAHGYLRGFLEALGVPASSQCLVFSKTSLQASRISPQSPRAIYFNDDVYVGWVRGSDILEVSGVDPQLGGVFYTMSQKPAAPVRIERQTHACLQCHDSRGLALGVPGHLVRSVYPGGDGLPLFHLGTFKVDDRTPYEQRWGGWYVTGTHGAMRHLGNVTFPDNRDADLSRLRDKGANLTRLPERVDAEAYLTDTSDLVALLVLEHQAFVHNLITRANHETRVAIVQSEDLNRLSGMPGGPLTEGSRARIRSACEPLLEGLLFSGEAPLPGPVAGTSTFAADFEKRGPFDAEGRSLRKFDLKTRLFRHPCSYLVHSRAFAGLPETALEYLADRMREILDGRDARKEFAHLSAEDRAAVSALLRATVPPLATRWPPREKE